MPGHRQLAALADADEGFVEQPKKRRALGSAGHHVQASLLVTCLLQKWAWGVLSAADIQELAMAAKLSAINDEEELDILASIGGYGAVPGHAHRDLMLKFVAKKWSPEPISVTIPFKDTKDVKGSTNFTDVKICLPSSWLATMASNPALEVEFQALFGPQLLEEWWSKQAKDNPQLQRHPVLLKHNYNTKAIPVFIHGDGASYMHNDSLLTLSFSGVLKEGTILETNLVICAWPKNSAASGKTENTMKTLWQWIAWDFNQLFANRWADKDPWGQALPEDMAMKAGRPILPNDFCIVVWGVLGDNEFFQVELGCPHHACTEPRACCHLCSCGKSSKDNHWFNWEGLWVGSASRHEPKHPINAIRGWTPWHFVMDWLHCVDLGVASHAVGNILFEVVFQKLKSCTRAVATSRIALFLAEHPAEQGSDFDSLELKHFCNPGRPHQDSPETHFLKAAQVRGLVHRVHLLFQQYASNTQADRQMLLMIQCLDTVYQIMHSASMFFSGEEYRAFRQAGLQFLASYSWLNKKMGPQRFKEVPKFHYFFHLLEQSRYLNPRTGWCYGGEDLVGKISALAHSCTRGTASHMVVSKMMDKYLIAKHLEWARQ